MGSDYRFLTVWRVAGTVQEVMAVLGDAESLPRWWPSVYLSVVPMRDAAPDGTGTVVDLHTKGWLPYTLRWALTITEPMTDTGFALTAACPLNPVRWPTADVRLAMPEAVEAIRGLWTGESVRHHGGHDTVGHVNLQHRAYN
jgi:hypothetical protein